MTAARSALALAPALAMLATACGRPDVPPAGPPVPEPASALRPADARGEVPEDAHVVDYALRAVLDAEAHSIAGHARIRWRNTSRHEVRSLPLHLYMNGFRAEDTAWMREARGTHRGHAQDAEAPWGWIDLTTVEAVAAGGTDGREQRTALAWAEATDPSLATVELPAAVPPGGELVLEIDFVTQLPRVFARTGFDGDFHMVGQWFPKLGVLDEDGTWRAHVFTFHSEFYADFGDYDVVLDVPADMVVGATGILVGETTDGARKQLTYRAEMVHDFAWTADPKLLERSIEHDGIRIRQLYRAEHEQGVQAHFDAQVAALDSMQRRFGPYPWSTITLVVPPEGAGGAGGMEYPTLYTSSPAYVPPRWVQALGFEEHLSGRFTTIHEFGHQYFQGLLASDESRQPWLDEGMNTTSNALVLADWLGPDAALARFAGVPIHASDALRLGLRRGDTVQIVDAPAEAFSPIVGGYGGIVYQKTAATMLTLRNLAGHDVFDRALRAYVDEWRFRHPTGADLERELVEGIGDRVTLSRGDPARPGSGVVALDVRDYFEQTLRTTRTAGFAVKLVRNEPRLGTAGWHRDASGKRVGGEPIDVTPEGERGDADVEAVAVIVRTGELEVPVTIEARFTDGTSERLVWSGRERATQLRWPGRRVERVAVDPDGALLLETERLDNARWAAGAEPELDLAEATGDLAESIGLAVLLGVGP